MSLMYATTFATDFFRISYQGIEAVSDQTPAQNLTFSDRIAQTMRRHIALIDTFLVVGQHVFAHDRFKELIIPFRLLSTGLGLYQFNSHIPAEIKAAGDMIILNVLNISIVVTRTLNPQLSTGLSLIDASYRLFQIVDRRTALVDWIKDLAHQIDFQRIKDAAFEGFSYLGRTALVSLMIYACYARGTMELQSATLLYTNTLHEIYEWTLLGSALASLIGVTVNLTFDKMGMSTYKKLIAVIANISSAMILSLCAVGLGRVPSLTALITPILPAGCTLLLGVVLWKVFRIAIHELFDKQGIQSGNARTLAECAITAFGTIPLTILTTVGMGISKTIPESLALIGKMGSIGLIAIPCLSCSAVLCGRTLLLGIPSMDEMVTWHNKLYTAPVTILNELLG